MKTDHSTAHQKIKLLTITWENIVKYFLFKKRKECHGLERTGMWSLKLKKNSQLKYVQMFELESTLLKRG